MTDAPPNSSRSMLGLLSFGVEVLSRAPALYATYYAAFVIDPDGHKLEAVHK